MPKTPFFILPDVDSTSPQSPLGPQVVIAVSGDARASKAASRSVEPGEALSDGRVWSLDGDAKSDASEVVERVGGSLESG